MAKQIVYSQIIFDVLLRRFSEAAGITCGKTKKTGTPVFLFNDDKVSRQVAENVLRAVAGIEPLAGYLIRVEDSDYVKLPRNTLVLDTFAATEPLEDPSGVVRLGYCLLDGEDRRLSYLQKYQRKIRTAGWKQYHPSGVTCPDFPKIIIPGTLEFEAFEALHLKMLQQETETETE